MENYQETLKQSGLTDAQAMVYSALLANGSQKAGTLAKKVALKRGLIYKALDELVSFGLVAKREDVGKVATFEPKHPAKLRELVESRAKKLKDAELVLDGLMPSLVSEFNLISGHPGVLVYEGREGVERVINDSLSSKTEIYTYADIESVTKYVNDINKRYVAKRDRLGIHKKALLLDTPFARDYMKNYHRLVTDVKLVGLQDIQPFQSVMEIYDGKIAYVTFAPERMTGVIIEDPYLYAMHKYLFECLWNATGGGKENNGTAVIPPMPDEPVGKDEYFTRL